LILQHAPLVRYVANRIFMRLPSSVDVEDLYQVGTLGLIDAVSRFDPSRGIRFQTYAEFRIRGAILDELRALDWVPRGVRHVATQIEEAYRELETEHGRPAEDQDVAAKLGISLSDLYGHLDDARSVSFVSFEELRASSRDDDEDWDAMEMLADRSLVDPIEKLGLDELRTALGKAIDSLPERERLVITLYYFEELTMGEIGAVLGLTESRISQLHSRATLRIRARIRKELTCPKK
jgi:RNA polymerase sigma factor for flagellar operon FliA